MKISIAMATYNGAAHVREQLESFVHQSRRPDEVVITDDQSSDDTAAVVHAFARSAPFEVRFEVNERNLRVAQNFDRALSLCTGDLVFLSDQDDVWLPEKIATIVDAAQAHPDRSCFMTDALMADGELRPTGKTKLGQIRAAGLPDSAFVMGCCAAFDRRLLSILLPIPATQRAHDNWMVQVADLMGQTLRIEVPLQYYRRHGQNVSDFFVNRLQSVGRAQAFKERLASVRRRFSDQSGFHAELGFFNAAAARMHEASGACVELLGPQRADQALTAAQARAGLLVRRSAIRAKPRSRRLPAIWGLWREGGYQACGRVPGAMKDLLVSAPCAASR